MVGTKDAGSNHHQCACCCLAVADTYTHVTVEIAPTAHWHARANLAMVTGPQPRLLTIRVVCVICEPV